MNMSTNIPDFLEEYINRKTSRTPYSDGTKTAQGRRANSIPETTPKQFPNNEVKRFSPNHPRQV